MPISGFFKRYDIIYTAVQYISLSYRVHIKGIDVAFASTQMQNIFSHTCSLFIHKCLSMSSFMYWLYVCDLRHL